VPKRTLHISQESQTFLQIYGSPFTDPTSLPQRAVVPDPSVRTPTASAHLSTYFTVNADNEGNVAVLASANPFGPLPYICTGVVGPYVAPTGATLPLQLREGNWTYPERYWDDNNARSPWAAQAWAFYDTKQQPLLQQIQTLAPMVRRGRPVACGVKMNVGNVVGGVTSGVVNGNQVNAYTATTIPDPPTFGNLSGNFTAGATMWGEQYQFLNGIDADDLVNFLNAHSSGDLFRVMEAKEGVTVRWTDPNKFEMLEMAEINSTVFFLTKQLQGTLWGQGLDDNDAAINLYIQHTDGYIGTNLIRPGMDTSGEVAWLSSSPVPHVDAVIYCSNGRTPGWNARNLGTTISQWRKGNMPFALAQGLQPGQQVTVQIAWNWEYEPVKGAPVVTSPSFVDPGFDTTILPMLADRNAFPIVVKGHSFFSKLAAAVKKGAHTIGRIMQGASKIASGVSADPRVQAISVGGTMMGGALQQF